MKKNENMGGKIKENEIIPPYGENFAMWPRGGRHGFESQIWKNVQDWNVEIWLNDYYYSQFMHSCESWTSMWQTFFNYLLFDRHLGVFSQSTSDLDNCVANICRIRQTMCIWDRSPAWKVFTSHWFCSSWNWLAM